MRISDWSSDVCASDLAPLASSLGAAVGAATAAAVTLGAHAQGADDASNPGVAPSGAKGYQSSSPDEAAFVEALVNVMCPANELTPNGVDCGLATVIDRQLADGCRSGAARVIKDVIDNTPDMTRAARRLFGKSVTATACGPASLIRRPPTTKEEPRVGNERVRT